jgi:hypothetical protein
MGKRELMAVMETLSGGGHVKNSEWISQNAGSLLPTREPTDTAAESELYVRDAHEILEEMTPLHAKVLQMAYGFEPYGRPQTAEEINAKLNIHKPKYKTKGPISAATAKRAVRPVKEAAYQEFNRIALDKMQLAKEAKGRMRWNNILRTHDQWHEKTPIKEPAITIDQADFGPSGRELMERFGTPERVRIYTAAVRAGHGERTAKILEKEQRGKATRAEKALVRKEFHVQRDKERQDMFNIQTRTRTVDPSEVKDFGPGGVGTPATAPHLYVDDVLGGMVAVVKRGNK